MKAPAFDYVRPGSLAGVTEALAEGEGKILAGGQSLGPMLNLRLARPPRLIDISGCAELRAVSDEGGYVIYGAAITHADIEDGRVPDPTPGWLQNAARRIAYRAIRNRGTIGGSLAHADPAADWLTVLAGLNAEVFLRRGAEVMAFPLGQFVLGPFQTQLGVEDVLIAVRVPRPPPEARWGYTKLSTKRGEFAESLSVVFAEQNAPHARVVLGGLGRAPLIAEVELARLQTLESTVGYVAEALPELDSAGRRLHAGVIHRAIEQLDAPGSESR